MRILILHRVPYYKIDYARGINHDIHDVTYIGTESALADIPTYLRCKKIVRPGLNKVSDEVLAAIENEMPFDRIISLSEYELMDAAEVREHLAVEGPSVESTRLVRDKIAMKEAVANHGIRVPQFLSTNKIPDKLPWRGRTVLKPIDGASSENVFIFNSSETALEAVKKRILPIHEFSESRYEVEEFIEGPILHIDGLVKEGEFVTALASQYLGTCLEYAKGSPLGSIQIPNDPELFAWALRCLKAVGLFNGSFHLEAIRSTDGLVFLEVGARVGGADVVQCYELATQIHLPSAELSIILNESQKIGLPKPQDHFYGWFVFPGHHYPFHKGHVSGSHIFKNHRNVVRWNELPSHSELPRKITYQAKEVPVAGVIGAPVYHELIEFLQEAFLEIKVCPATSVISNRMQGVL